MTLTNIRARRFIAVGAFAVAAVAAPFAASAITTPAVQDNLAGPACLAWFGNKEDGKCLSYSNGNYNIGTPIYDGGNSPNSGFTTGPLLPGTTINQGIG